MYFKLNNKNNKKMKKHQHNKKGVTSAISLNHAEDQRRV